MDEFISRQRVLKELEELDNRLMRGHYVDECVGVTMANSIVQSVPAENLQKVVVAKWERCQGCDSRDNFYKCSLCGRTINIICGDSLENYPYCHCGAKMIGE